MRNYFRVGSATLVGNDGVNDLTLVFFEQFAGQAISQAQGTAEQLLLSGWTSATAFPNPPINFLLHKDTVTGSLIQNTQGSQPAGGLLGYSLWQYLLNVCAGFGVDPFISPKEQRKRPWNVF